MCTISGTCGCDRGTGTFLLALGGQMLLWLVKAAAHALLLALVLLILAGKWATPRAYRLARRGYRSARHRWATRPVVLDRQPPAGLPQQPTEPTLVDLRLKKEANV
ncbi:hypothetical protein O7602_26590 [Micromonospora sp. WMMD1128]|uniref:hypothetical protein n=1 Tax=Micromonospora sp. WMMD1128 TaxID=3015150 RepID=UPI00248C6070|nr:hypothetical protein [Micromonospora sp. WMMD1128]WBB73212.1 hypothetical protein O7602_26590 [Micromonospora sp. WMMD1128]